VLTTLMLFPGVAALLLIFIPKDNQKLLYKLNIAVSLVPLIMVLLTWPMFSAQEPILSILERKEWIPSLGVSYALRLDGVNLPFITMVTFLTVVVNLIPPVPGENLKKKSMLLLIWEATLIGGFLAQDYVLFLMFWAATTVPIYLLMEPSTKPEKLTTARSYLLSGLVSIVALGVGLLILSSSIDTPALAAEDLANTIITHLDPNTQWWVFLAIFVGCALRIPIFPFQIWLRLTIGHLPVSAGILLMGGFMPLGVYTLLRFALMLLPDAMIAFTLVLAAAGAVNLIFGALAALGAEERNQKAAYQSMVYTGIALLGMASNTMEAFTGSLYTLLALGTAMAFSLTLTHLTSGQTSLQGWPLVLYGLEAAQQLRLPGFPGFIGLLLVFSTASGGFPRVSLAIIVALFFIAIDYARFLAGIMQGPHRKEPTQPTDSCRTFRSPPLGTKMTAILLLSGSLLLGCGCELILGVIEPAITQIMPLLN